MGAADVALEQLSLAEDDPARPAVEAVVAASRSLTRLLLATEAAVDVLRRLDAPVEIAPDDLVRTKQLEFLRIAARDLVGIDPLEAVGRSLADLADRVLAVAAAGTGVAVIGMGKLGGCELNYASDVDVMFVGGTDAEARRVMDTARTCFRMDADLRPEGRDGRLTRSLDSFVAYWDRWAQPWEFQALLKVRPVAGDAALGRAFAEAAAARVWGRPLGADELRSLRTLKARAEAEVARKGLAERELKRGRGGIRDIEFAVQLLQLVHGRDDPALRSPTTLDALAQLAAAGYVDQPDAVALSDAYRFLRTAEHRVQLVDEQQVHQLPTAAAALESLARTMGYRDGPDASAVERFDTDMRHHRAVARGIHERLFFRPLLEAFTGDRPMPEGAVRDRLIAFGFTDVERTRQALEELTSGLSRTSKLMQQMLPLLLEWLSDSPDPDLGLLGLRTLSTGAHRRARLVETFRESPEAARRLCRLVGTSRLLLTGLERHPDVITELMDDDDLAAPAPSQPWRPLPRFRQAEELRVAIRDVLAIDSVEATAAALTALAETVLDAVLAELAPPVPMCIVAMGRFGGAELSYASDLDILLVHSGTTAEDAAVAEEAAERLLRTVKGDTPSARVYLLDADLRPEGRQGPLARSLDGYRAYYERYAQTWERQALVRARPVAGDRELGTRFMDLVRTFVWAPPFTEADAREVRRMKARIERERIPAGEDPQFHLKLGRGSLSDVEWTVQLLQLQHDIPAPGTMAAIAALARSGVLDAEDAAVLADSYRFCERTRNRWYLVKGAPGDSLPTAAEQLTRLARSLDTTPAELRDHYRRVTRRARTVVERLFYERGSTRTQ